MSDINPKRNRRSGEKLTKLGSPTYVPKSPAGEDLMSPKTNGGIGIASAKRRKATEILRHGEDNIMNLLFIAFEIIC